MFPWHTVPSMKKKLRPVLLLSLILPLAADAAQILLAPANVIGYNGVYNTGTYGADNILDAQIGAISEQAQDGSYWINSDNGPANAYIVIDLGSTFHLASFTLFNTHNANFNDRGTGDFSIEAANAVGIGPGGSVGFDLAGPIATLVTGTLTAASQAVDPLVAQNFTSSDSGLYRYIRFSPHSVAVSGSPCCGANVYGLNELRAFDGPVTSEAPEPASLALFGAGLLGVGLLRKRLAYGHFTTYRTASI
jgi:hypothetical protein